MIGAGRKSKIKEVEGWVERIGRGGWRQAVALVSRVFPWISQDSLEGKLFRKGKGWPRRSVWLERRE